MKKCSKCKIEKSLTEFSYIVGLKKNGRYNECNNCRNNYFREKLIEIGGIEYYNKAIFEQFVGNLRSRTYQAFRRMGYRKTSKTQEMLGVDWEIVKQHIERQFTKGMNWDNYGQWQVDHVIPLASAKDEKEILGLCHYSNLQPLWAKDNLSKRDKIDNQQTLLRI